MNDTALKRLAEGLRRRRRLTPGVRGREWLIHWLGGGGKEEREAAESVLGVAGDDPEWLEAAYRGLDRVLFDGGRLSAKAAGLAGMDDDSARRRYRQLIKVFHPDRFPDLAEWLTPRSQAIHEAYARFKRGETADDEAAPVAGSTPRRRPPDVRRPRIRDAGPLWPALVAGWRARLRRVRNLPQKILALVAVVALLPVVHLYLAANGPEPAPVTHQSAGTPEPAEEKAALGPVVATAGGDAREAPWWYAGGGLGVANHAQSGPAEPVVVPVAAQSEPEQDREAAGDGDEAETFREVGEELLERWLMLLGPEFRPDRPRAVPGDTGMDREALDALERDTAPRYQLPPLPEPEESPDAQAVEEDSGNAEPGEVPARDRETGAEPGAADAVESEPDPRPEDLPDADTGADGANAAVVDQVPEPDVLALLEGYRASIENGDLGAFMSHFGANPWENNNHGRRWFQENYGRLFRDTEWRRFYLDIQHITRNDAGEWEVLAGYEMRIAFPDGRQRTSTGQTRYTIIREADRWVIAGIEH